MAAKARAASSDPPEPAFGIQLVYNDTQHPELVTPVRDGDAVLMPSGYEHGHFLVVEGGWLAR